ncbi:MAG: 1,2-phenylacetyl-CoA epoxidase subunit PaaD [Chitinophagales bacterium]
MVNKKQIKEKLQEVKDPEIPTLSVLELGIITKIEIPEPNFVAIEMTPTFVGCPAIDFMRIKVQKAVESLDVKKVEVVVNYDKSWSSNLITEEGKKKLLEFGIAPPRKHKGEMESEDLEKAECPHCGSTNTTMNSPFGPTLCRAIHICYDCEEVFEQFKPV